MEKAKELVSMVIWIVMAITAMAIGVSDGGVGAVEASPAQQVATMETLFKPEAIRLSDGNSAKVSIETLFDLDGSVWLAVFNIKHDPNIVKISSFRCEGFLSSSISIGPIPSGNNTLMACVKQPGEVVDIKSTVVASFNVTRVGPGDTKMSFELNSPRGTQFYSHQRGKLVPGRTNQLTIFQEETVPTRDLARGSQVYLQGQGPRFLYFNTDVEWSIPSGMLGQWAPPDFSKETVGLLIGGTVQKIVKNAGGGLDIYISPINGEYHAVAFPKIPYGTPVQIR